MKTICLHCTVIGRVQGVFYRKNTLEQALLHGVSGWVRNQSNGSVEVVLCGEPDKVAAMKEWLTHGPPRAKVEQIMSNEIPCEHYTSFTVRN